MSYTRREFLRTGFILTVAPFIRPRVFEYNPKISVVKYTGDGIEPWGFECEKGKGQAYRDGDNVVYSGERDSIVHIFTKPALDISDYRRKKLEIPFKIVHQGEPIYSDATFSVQNGRVITEIPYPVTLHVVIKDKSGNRSSAVKNFTCFRSGLLPEAEDIIKKNTLMTLSFSLDETTSVLELIAFSGSSVNSNDGFRVDVGDICATLYR